MPKASADLPIRSKPKTQYPHIFGMGKRDRVLMALAVNRPMYVREIGNAICSEEKKTAKMVRALLEVGVAVASRTSCGARYVTLNPDFPAYRELFRLLNVMELHWPQERLDKPERKAERLALRRVVFPTDDGPFPTKRYDRLFGTPIRTRVLLAIAAIGDTDVADLTRLLLADNRSIWNTANHWQREGVIRSIVIGRRRALQLDPAYFAFREIRRLLRRLVTDSEYAVLARFSRRNPNGVHTAILR